MRSIRDLLNISGARQETRALLCSAIWSRRVIKFYYHDGYRTVEPFCLGLVRAGADNESLFCYQTGGYSELREVVGWKLYRVSEIEDIEVTRGEFDGNRPDYDPDDVLPSGRMAKIYCCVTPIVGAERIIKKAPEVAPALHHEITRVSLTHNERMRMFRFTHPTPIPELYTNIFSAPSVKPLPERPELKSKPLMPVFSPSLLSGQAMGVLAGRHG